MKNKKLIFSIVLAMLLLLASITGSVAISLTGSNDPVKGYQGLASTINECTSEADENLFGYVDSLKKIIASVSPDFLTSEIQNAHNSNYLKVAILQLCTALNINIDYEKLTPLLTDSSIDFEVRRNILTNIYMKEDANIDLIEEVAKGADLRLGFTAIRYLWFLAPEKAITIADDVINSYKGGFNYQIKGAVMIKGLELFDCKNEKEINQFLTFCNSILVDSQNQSDFISDSVYYAIRDLKSKYVFSYVLSSSYFDSTKKYSAVKSNMDLLTDIANNELNDENAQLLLLAYKYCNTDQLKEVISSAMKNNIVFFDKNPLIASEFKSLFS